MENLIVRKLQKEEIAGIRHIADVNDYPGDELIKDMEDMFSDSNEKPTFLVAVLEGRVVGFIGYRSTWMDFGSFSIFWVMVQLDLQRKGIGKKMMHWTLEKIRSEPDAKHVMLSTSKPRYYMQFDFQTYKVTKEGKSIMYKELWPI